MMISLSGEYLKYSCRSENELITTLLAVIPAFEDTSSRLDWANIGTEKTVATARTAIYINLMFYFFFGRRPAGSGQSNQRPQVL